MSESEPMSGPHDCGGDAAAYVLGALEPDEAEQFRLHLEGCAVCRDEVEALGGVVQALPMATPQHPASRRLRRRVMRAVRDQPAPDRPVQHRRLRARRPRVAAVAAVVVAVALATLGGLALSGGSGRPARVIDAQVAGIAGSAQLRVSGGRGELIVRRLSPPPPGHVYEVWLKAPRTAPVPASVLFSVSSAGDADVTLPHSLRGVSQVMVTPEPDGGSRSPTHTPVIVASLT